MPNDWPALSSREKQCLDLLAEGLTAGEIGYRLGVQKVTVDLHVGNLKRKLKARTREQAVAMAVRHTEGGIPRALENAPLIGITLDPEGCVTYANAHFLAVTGWKNADIIGKNWFETCLPAEEAAATSQALAVNAARPEAARFIRYEYQNEVLRRDGTRLQIAWFNVLTRDGEGKVSTVMALGLDVTERDLAEKALRDSERFFLHTFRSSPVPMVITAPADGRLLDANTKWLQLFKRRRHETLGKTDVELRVWVVPRLRETFVERIRHDGSAVDFEGAFLTAEGEERHAILNGELIRWGNEARLLIAFNDITDRRQAERALRASEARFFKAFQSSPAAMSITRLDDGLYRDVNRVLLRMLGYERQEVIGKTSVELGFWVDVEQRRIFAERLRRKGTLRDYKAAFLTRDGRRRDVLVAAEILEEDDGDWIISSFDDITERQRD